MAHRFTVQIKESRGVQTVSRTVREELPRDVLDSAVQYSMQALGDAQMGLNVGEGRPHNNAGTGDGKWPWETDSVLPHEIHDAIESGDLTRKELEQIIEGEEE